MRKLVHGDVADTDSNLSELELQLWITSMLNVLNCQVVSPRNADVIITDSGCPMGRTRIIRFGTLGCRDEAGFTKHQ